MSQHSGESGSEETGDLLARARGRGVPFLDLLEIRPIEARPGRAVFEMTVAERHLRTRGMLHGGVTATLLDTAMGFAAVTVAPPGCHVVTLQMNLNYVRPARRGEKLIASGQIRHRGSKTVVTAGEIRLAGEQALVATGTATFMFIPDPPQEQDD